jgi:hypothetical protein
MFTPNIVAHTCNPAVKIQGVATRSSCGPSASPSGIGTSKTKEACTPEVVDYTSHPTTKVPGIIIRPSTVASGVGTRKIKETCTPKVVDYTSHPTAQAPGITIRPSTITAIAPGVGGGRKEERFTKKIVEPSFSRFIGGLPGFRDTY